MRFRGKATKKRPRLPERSLICNFGFMHKKTAFVVASWLQLWQVYTRHRENSLIVALPPLPRDATTWVEVVILYRFFHSKSIRAAKDYRGEMLMSWVSAILIYASLFPLK